MRRVVACHRGTSRPVPLAALIADAATIAGADSAVRAYRALRERFYGRDAYDFGTRPGCMCSEEISIS
jgi:hypothetical protein